MLCDGRVGVSKLMGPTVSQRRMCEDDGEGINRFVRRRWEFGSDAQKTE